jgi:hypothetical protein
VPSTATVWPFRRRAAGRGGAPSRRGDPHRDADLDGGVTPNPLLAALSLERDRRGAVMVDSTLAVRGRAGVWALGGDAGPPGQDSYY